MPTRRYEINLVIQAQQFDQSQQKIDKIAAAVQGIQRESAAMDASFARATGSAAAIGVAVGGIALAAATARKAVQDYTDALKQADDAQKRWAGGANRKIVSEVELASMLGEKPGAAFSAKQAQFSAETGLGEQRGRQFKMGLYESGAQFIGADAGPSRTMSKAQAAEYEKRAGLLATETGIAPELVGDLGGVISGKTDWQGQHGDKAGEQAALELKRVLKVLQVGRGRNSTMVSQMTRAMADLIKRDREQGLARDPVALAGMVSAMAERSPAASSTFLERGLEGLFSEGGESGKIRKAAGVEYGDDPEAAAEKLRKYVDPRRKQGQSREQWLESHGFDRREKIALGGLMDARQSGLLAQRAAVAAAITPESMRRDNAALASDEAFGIQQATAANESAEARRGLDNSQLERAREAMKAQMISDGRLGTRRAAKDLLAQKWHPANIFASMFGGTAPDEASQIDMALSASMPAPHGGYRLNQWDSSSPLTRTEVLRKQLGEFQGSGHDLSELVPLLRQLNQSMDKLVGAAKAEAPIVPNHGQMGGMIHP